MDFSDMKIGDASGWAQFLGSLGSIWLIWWMARRQEHLTEKAMGRDRYLRSAAIAAAALPSLQILYERVKILSNSLPTEIRAAEQKKRILQYEEDQMHSRMAFNTPHALSNHGDQLHLLERDVAISVFKFLTSLHEYQNWVENRKYPEGVCFKVRCFFTEVEQIEILLNILVSDTKNVIDKFESLNMDSYASPSGFIKRFRK